MSTEIDNSQRINEIKSEAEVSQTNLQDQLLTSSSMSNALEVMYALRASNGDPKVEGYVLPSYETGDELKDAMRHVFDFRTGPNGEYRERWEVEEDVKRYTSGMTETDQSLMFNAAEEFGLVGSTSHLAVKKDAELILGGGATAPIDRSKYLYKQLESGKLATQLIIALGSERTVDSDEIARAGDYAGESKTESDLMRHALATVFSLDPNSFQEEVKTVDTMIVGVPNEQRLAKLSISGFPNFVVVSAAVITDPYFIDKDGNKSPRVRSNTPDTLRTTVNEKLVLPGSEVGVVTHAHYRPFQGSDVSRILGSSGIRAEVIGFDPSEFNRPQKKTHELTQELFTLADRTFI